MEATTGPALRTKELRKPATMLGRRRHQPRHNFTAGLVGRRLQKGWSATGWRVEQRERAGRVVYCAKRVTLPPTDTVDPTKPTCSGGSLVMLKTLPPRWSCVCPEGTTRQRTGNHSYACKGSPGGGTQSDPKKDCLKKGWKWTRKGCVDPNGQCPKGYIGKPPYCLKLPPKCPKGYVGTPPKCTKVPFRAARRATSAASRTARR